MARHKCKELTDLLADMQKDGFRVEFRGGTEYAIYAPNGKDMRYCHFGERGFHPVRRWYKAVMAGQPTAKR